MTQAQSSFCQNGCQLFRELVSGGLLAGGLFWITATIILFASELVSGGSATLNIDSGLISNLVHVAAGALGNVVGELPGYRMVLALAGTMMVIQSRTLSKLDPWKTPLIISGVAGALSQLYIGLGSGALWVSGIFLALIILGLLLTAGWLWSIKRSTKPPVFIDNQGRYFIKPRQDAVMTNAAGESESTDDHYDRVLAGMTPDKASGTAPATTTAEKLSVDERSKPAAWVPKKAQTTADSSESLELPPLPESNVSMFPGVRQRTQNLESLLSVDDAGIQEIELSVDMTQEIEAPIMPKILTSSDDTLEDDDEYIPELEKTMVLERPAFLNDMK